MNRTKVSELKRSINLIRRQFCDSESVHDHLLSVDGVELTESNVKSLQRSCLFRFLTAQMVFSLLKHRLILPSASPLK